MKTLYFGYDYETRSDLSVVAHGLEKHSLHPGTDILALCCRQVFEDKSRGPMLTWRGAFADGETADAEDDWDVVEPFWEHVERGGMVLAHNEAYDRRVSNGQRDKYGLPEIKIEQSIDSAAWFRQFNLPSSLADVSKMLLPAAQAKLTGVATGVKYMWSKEHPLISAADMVNQVQYCGQDVDAMLDLMKLMPNPTPSFLEEYWAMCRMNMRGCPVDLDMARAAVALKPRVDRGLLKDIEEACGSDVKLRGPSFLKWLQENLPSDLVDLLVVTKKKRHGYEFRSVKKLSADKAVRARLLEAMEDRTDCGHIREAIWAFEEANRAAVTKYAAILKVEAEGVVHDQFVFAGAAQTGRASAKGIQLQNTIRDVPKNAEDIMDKVIELQRHPVALEAALEGSINQAMSRVVRPTLIAAEGMALGWSDWSSVEARGLPWLSGDDRAEPLLDIFRSGGDVYIREAAGIYGFTEQNLIDRLDDGDPVAKEQRQIGKVSILSCGYQGGVGAFQAMAKNYGLKIPDSQAKQIKNAWRANNPWAVSLWQKTQNAAMRAVRRPKEPQRAGRVTYVFVPELLRGTLLAFMPSGRFLAYPQAAIKPVKKFDEPEDSLVFVHPQYGGTATYGGALVENYTQGECATLLREALVRCDKSGLNSVLQVHDELVIHERVEVIEDRVADLVAEMERVPTWAGGFPIAAEAEIGFRYKCEW